MLCEGVPVMDACALQVCNVEYRNGKWLQRVLYDAWCNVPDGDYDAYEKELVKYISSWYLSIFSERLLELHFSRVGAMLRWCLAQGFRWRYMNSRKSLMLITKDLNQVRCRNKVNKCRGNWKVPSGVRGRCRKWRRKERGKWVCIGSEGQRKFSECFTRGRIGRDRRNIEAPDCVNVPCGGILLNRYVVCARPSFVKSGKISFELFCCG